MHRYMTHLYRQQIKGISTAGLLGISFFPLIREAPRRMGRLLTLVLLFPAFEGACDVSCGNHLVLMNQQE